MESKAVITRTLQGAAIPLRAIHQFHAGSATGDGITNGMFFTRRILRELGFRSEIFAIHIPTELRGEILPHTQHSGSMSEADELLLVHYSMGHDEHAWIDAVSCPKILVYHNITPERFLLHETLRRYAGLGRQQLRRWGEQMRPSSASHPFIGALAASNFNAAELREIGFESAPLETLPLLIDLDWRRRAAGAPRLVALDRGAELPAKLLFVGRITEHKCQHDLIVAFAHLRNRLTRPSILTLVGIGEPSYIEKLRRLARQHGVADAVEITGKVSEVELARHYRESDLFLCLSEHEGFCIPLLEAAVHGVPVLAYGGGGAITETLGEGGLIMLRKDPEEVAAAAALLLEEPELRRRVLEGQSKNLARFEPALLRGRLAAFLERLGFVLPKQSEGANAKHSPIVSGYRIEGPFTSSYSLAVVNRELGLALARAGETVELRSMEGQTGDFPPDSDFLASHPEVASLSTGPGCDPDVRASPAEVSLRNSYPPRPDDLRATGLRGLACYAWEESGFPQAYAEGINRSLNLVTVTSRHVRQLLQDNGVHVPIFVVGNGTDHLERTAPVPDRHRAEELLGQRAPGFRFLHVSSCFPRKGIDVLLKAWARLSEQDGWSASLVIKTFPNPHNTVREQVAKLGPACSSSAPILVLEDELTEPVLRGLYQACDAFVAPSRAEGYGLPLAEAMLMGKPVITTGWGGQTDFCTEETAWLVDWEYAYARTHLGVFDSVWAEPNLDHLVHMMREVRRASPTALRHRLEAGRRTLQAHHRWDHVAERVRKAVAEVRAQPAQALRLPRVAVASTWNSRCGIATYAEAVSRDIPQGHLTVLANEDATPLLRDEPYVQRVWQTGLKDDLSRLERAIASAEADVVVFQFNFGFFRLDALTRLISLLTSKGKAVHVVFHSTADVRKPDLQVSLRDHVAGLALATRLLVHSLEDLNRLRSFGLSANVALFPHGAPTLPGGAVEDRASFEAAQCTRTALRLADRPVLATFGYLLPHKGLREAIQALQFLHHQAKSEGTPLPHLIMANSLYPVPVSENELRACQSLITKLGLSEAVTLIHDYLPEAEALSLLRMADTVVYPYQETQESSSGAVRIGLASGRPIAVTPLPIFEDVRDVTYQLPGRSPQELAVGLRQLLEGTGAWRSPATRNQRSMASLASRQSDWIATHAWPRVARRFWGLLRATAPSAPH